jgi:hypothetical protein
MTGSALLRNLIEMSVAELFGEPDDQVVVHDHPCSLAERLLATAGSPAIPHGKPGGARS